MKAILLAAGRGRRMGIDEPKCLVEIAGRSLLARHLENMPRAGITSLTIVTGHGASRVADALSALDPQIPVTTVHNTRFMHGAIVSLQCVASQILEGGIWMDADVLYPAELLRRLVDSTHGNCVLLDGRSEEQGEEMMLAVRDGRVQRIARRVGTSWDLVGESVGFFKVDATGAAAMKIILDGEVEAGRVDQEHEDALNAAFSVVSFGYERVDDFEWTEIDFPEDVDKAARLASGLDA